MLHNVHSRSHSTSWALILIMSDTSDTRAAVEFFLSLCMEGDGMKV